MIFIIKNHFMIEKVFSGNDWRSSPKSRHCVGVAISFLIIDLKKTLRRKPYSHFQLLGIPYILAGKRRKVNMLCHETL